MSSVLPVLYVISPVLVKYWLAVCRTLEIIDRIIQEMDKHLTPINIYIDLSKAFDTIDRNILMDTLKHYGIKGTAFNLFKNFLSNRKQYVQNRY